jgi:hypothetical protein
MLETSFPGIQNALSGFQALIASGLTFKYCSRDIKPPRTLHTPFPYITLEAMKPYLTRILSFVAPALFVLACQKQVNETLPSLPAGGDTTSLSRETVNASISGRILDDAGLPLQGATVKAGGSTTTTNEYGIFSFRDISVSKQFGYVRVEKQGFFPGSRTVQTNSTSGNFVEIQLIKKALKGTFNSTEKASVQINENTIIGFPDHAIVDANGLQYDGKVNVYGAVINPANANFSRTMPGDLRGLRSDSSVTALISYGMVTVNLETESGQKLQLAPTKSASIRQVISAELMARAPSTIPMWHFDETEGIWKEEGKAVKTGDSYEGMVSHFSTWNFDDPAQSILVSMKLVYENDQPVPYTRVKISESNGYVYNTGYTDSTGYSSIRVIKGVPLKLVIFDPASHTLLSKDLGVLSENTDLGDIVIALEKAQIKITGEITNCDDILIENGAVTLLVEGLFYPTRTVEGRFELPLAIDPGAGITAKLVLEDLDRGISEFMDIELTSGSNEIGTIKLCAEPPVTPEPIDEYVKYMLGNDSTEYRPAVDSFFYDKSSLSQSWLFVAKDALMGGEDLQFNWDKTANGIRFELMKDYPSTYMDNGMNLIQLNHNGVRYDSDDSTAYTVVKYGALNEAIEFNFSGTMSDSLGNSLPINGAFRIRRR